MLKCDFLSIKVTFKESVSSLDLHIEVFPVLSVLSVCIFFPLLNLPRCVFLILLPCQLISPVYIASMFHRSGVLELEYNF